MACLVLCVEDADMDDAIQQFGENVRRARHERGWTQEDLSAKTGLAVVSNQTKVPPRRVNGRGRGTERQDLPMQPEDIPRAAPPVVVIYGQESENEVLADELALDGYDVRLVRDPAMLGEVDLIVFGRAEQRGAGLGALRALRRGELAGSGARVLWMSTSSDAIDTLRAFEAGADDVIRAPFVYAELLARVRALMRRPTDETPPMIQCDALTIHTATRTVLYGSTPVKLPRREYALLLCLAR